MYTYVGVDSVGNSISEDDEVVFFRKKSGRNLGIALGTVFNVIRTEHVGYTGRATVLVRHHGGVEWFCHEDLMVI